MKSRVKDLIEAFVLRATFHRSESSVHVYEGRRLYSYAELMAEWKSGVLHVYPINRKSRTTSKHYNMLHTAIARYPVTWGIAPRELTPLP